MIKRQHVIYEIESTYFLRIIRNGYWQDAIYGSKGAAATAFTKLEKQGKVKRGVHAICERSVFHASVEKKRKTRNILNPAAGEFEVPVNTPLCCDPGSETYHSM